MLTGLRADRSKAPGSEGAAQAAIMGEDTRDPVIELDTRGVGLLRSWASPRTEFRVTRSPDGSIVLHPMFAHDADLWRSGLVEQIVENFSHPDQMIRLKPDKL
jgi:hypothetical protein